MSADRDRIYKAISDAFYDARNSGRTMTDASNAAADTVLAIVDEIDRNARAYGWSVGQGAPLTEVLVDVSDANPFLDPNWRERVQA